MSDTELIEQSITDRKNETTVTHKGASFGVQSGQSASWTTNGQPD